MTLWICCRSDKSVSWGRVDEWTVYIRCIIMCCVRYFLRMGVPWDYFRHFPEFCRAFASKEQRNLARFDTSFSIRFITMKTFEVSFKIIRRRKRLFRLKSCQKYFHSSQFQFIKLWILTANIFTSKINKNWYIDILIFIYVIIDAFHSHNDWNYFQCIIQIRLRTHL